MFGLHFIETGKMSRNDGAFFSDLFNKRFASDYEDFAEFQKETVEELYGNAIDFLKSAEMILMRENE